MERPREAIEFLEAVWAAIDHYYGLVVQQCSHRQAVPPGSKFRFRRAVSLVSAFDSTFWLGQLGFPGAPVSREGALDTGPLLARGRQRRSEFGRIHAGFRANERARIARPRPPTGAQSLAL